MSGEQTGSGAPPASPLGGLGMIWAQDRTGLLGARGEMLWRVPADFMHFKAATMGCGLVMGRTTWDSLGGALPGRRHVDPRTGGAAGLPRLWVIGGGSVYDQALAAGLPDVLVVSVLDSDASVRARERGLPESVLVRAPAIPVHQWRLDPARSDAPGTWRPVSGDARWRVETWYRL